MALPDVVALMLRTRVAFRREHTGDAAQDRVQRQAQQATQAVNALPFASGVWLRNVTIGTTDTVVNHGLGRVPRGYIVTRIQNNAAPFCESLPANQPTDKARQYAFIALGATVTVDLWIF